MKVKIVNDVDSMPEIEKDTLVVFKSIMVRNMYSALYLPNGGRGNMAGVRYSHIPWDCQTEKEILAYLFRKKIEGS